MTDYNVFDCPSCGLPAELLVVIVYYDPKTGKSLRRYILDCIGQTHDAPLYPEEVMEEQCDMSYWREQYS